MIEAMVIVLEENAGPYKEELDNAISAANILLKDDNASQSQVDRATERIEYIIAVISCNHGKINLNVSIKKNKQ